MCAALLGACAVRIRDKGTLTLNRHVARRSSPSRQSPTAADWLLAFAVMDVNRTEAGQGASKRKPKKKCPHHINTSCQAQTDGGRRRRRRRDNQSQIDRDEYFQPLLLLLHAIHSSI